MIRSWWNLFKSSTPRNLRGPFCLGPRLSVVPTGHRYFRVSTYEKERKRGERKERDGDLHNLRLTECQLWIRLPHQKPGVNYTPSWKRSLKEERNRDSELKTGGDVFWLFQVVYRRRIFADTTSPERKERTKGERESKPGPSRNVETVEQL